MAWYDYFNPVKAPGKIWGGIKGAGEAIDPANPYQDAAGQVRGIGEEARKQSQQQWNFQMVGLMGALDRTQPYANMAQNYAQNSRPGQMEHAFNYFGQDARQPTANSQVASDWSRYMANTPSATRQGQTNALTYLNGPLNSQQAFNQVQGAYGQQGQMERFFPQAQQALGSAGAAENFYRDSRQRFGQTTSPLEQLYGAGAGQFGSGQELRYANQQAQNFAAGPVNFTREGFKSNWQNIFGEVAGGTNDRLQEQLKQEMGQAGAAENWWDQTAKQGFSAETDFENFARQAMQGENAFINRQREKGLAEINQQMARRGGFNAGAAMSALGNYQAESEAQQAQYMAGLLQSAADAKMGRLSGGTQSAATAQQAGQARRQGLAGVISQERGDTLAAIQAAASIDAAEENARLGRQRLGLDAAGQVSNFDLQRGRSMMDLAAQVTSANQNALSQEMRAAETAQQMAMGRTTALGQMANQAQQGELQRLAGLMSASGMADTQTLARATQMFNMGKGVDEADEARFRLSSDLADRSDARRLEGYDKYMQSANLAQQAQSQREDDALRAMFNVANMQSQLFGGFYGQAGQLSGQAFSDYINTLSNAASLDAQGGAARWDALFSLGGLGVDYATGGTRRRG